MSSVETVADLGELNAPYGKQLKIQTVTFEDGGLQLLRIRIKEGKRFTMLDLDPATAQGLIDYLTDWKQKVNS